MKDNIYDVCRRIVHQHALVARQRYDNVVWPRQSSTSGRTSAAVVYVYCMNFYHLVVDINISSNF